MRDRMRVLVTLFVTCTASALPIAETFLTLWMKWMQQKKDCYPDLGCFSLEYPWFSWSRPIPVLPQPPHVVDTRFYLVTRSHPNVPVLMDMKSNLNGTEIDYDGKKWSFFIVHGYVGHYTDSWIQSLTYELLKLYDSNIILVDWSKGANIYNYIQAVANTRLVGAEMSRLTKFLISQRGANARRMHLIGYSLGAHISSYMTLDIKNIQRITGFDPAQPGFEKTDPLVRLDKTDANFVDIVHTNGRAFLGLGTRDSVGHVDFFINGGEYQPGCQKLNPKTKESTNWEIYNHIQFYLKNYVILEDKLNQSLQSYNITSNDYNGITIEGVGDDVQSILDFLSGKIASLLEYLVCSHHRAPVYYTESLKFRNCSFWGRSWKPFNPPTPIRFCKAEHCSEMGLHSILYPGRGNFYVDTNIKPPYCKWYPDVEAPMKNYLADIYLKQIFMNENGRSFE